MALMNATSNMTPCIIEKMSIFDAIGSMPISVARVISRNGSRFHAMYSFGVITPV